MLTLLSAFVAFADPLDPNAFSPLGTDVVNTGTVSIDTDALTMTGGYTGVVSNGVAVFAFDGVTLNDVNVTGSRPLALLSQADLTLNGLLNASATARNGGAGGFAGSAGGSGNTGGGPGGGGYGGLGQGGQGGSGAGHATDGGDGGDGNNGIPGGPAYGDVWISTLQGGSGGGGSQGPSDGGGGGGAVELGALGSVTIASGASVLAEGADGRNDNGGGAPNLGGGGGSGGAILLHGDTSSVCLGSLSVTGGNGGNAVGGSGGGGGAGGYVVQYGFATECTPALAGGSAGSGTNPGTAGGNGVSSTDADPDFDGDGFGRSTDCYDFDDAVNPDGTETCGNLLDDDCNGQVDEICDGDGDGFGAGSGPQFDCNDNNPNIYPGAPIIVGDGIDNDCSGDGEECWGDADGDGFTGGPYSSANNNCNQSGEFTTYTGDCDDSDANVNPDGTEVCDGVDNDCANGIDDGLTFADYWPDSDGDGEGDASVLATNACAQPGGTVTNGDDCDDGNSSINTSATEVCDGVDNDCANGIDDGLTFRNYWPDVDGDGFGDDAVGPTNACAQPANTVQENSDCDDSNANVNPTETEVTCDGLDNDCDPATSDPDADNDGVAVCTDCNDNDPARFPGNPEVCDGLDNDCDGQSDEGLTFDDYYTDDDGDTWGQTGTGVSSCNVLPGATRPGDCDDTPGSGAAINPGAAEQCDGIDNDCNGAADFGGGGQEVDADGDGYLRCEGDCRDTDNAIFPAAPELCDGKDNDCSNLGVPEDAEIDDDGDGYRECEGDCDDAENGAWPGNPEVCDGIDNDCANGTDDGLVFADYWRDQDGDGFGNATGNVVNACSPPNNRVANGEDCNDQNPNINPGAVEACDNVDNNCNGQVDDGVVNQDYYADDDGDGFGGDTLLGNDCQPPSPGAVPNSLDCNDADAAISPSADEVCDAIDHDCDGDVQNDLPLFDNWPDADGDGYGDSGATPVSACAPPTGLVDNGDDCDDSLASVRPGASEICDGIDNDCNGVADNGLPSQSYYDDPDGDGYGSGVATQSCVPVPGLVSLGGDCDETSPSVNPGAQERCDDIDNDCSGVVDDGLPLFDYWFDADGDGYGEPGTPVGQACIAPSGTSDAQGDCNDADPTIYPGAIEQCDGEDNNCNGLVDDNVATTDWFPDADGDGFGDETAAAISDCLQPSGTVANDFDCDDGDDTVNPAEDEICDGLDNDCDGEIDAGASVQGTAYYPDTDNDGFGSNTAMALNACSRPVGYVANRLDCADGNPAINPNAVEACPDLVDNDCDGLIDAADPNYTDTPVTFWFDQDGDGYGTPALTVEACSGDAPLGYVPPTVGLDCDDGEVATSPGGIEACDGIDNDCDTLADEGFPLLQFWPDQDGDTFGDALAAPVEICEEAALGTDLVQDGTDCDDSDDTVYPGAFEVCDDGVDNDCDGSDLVGFAQWADGDGDGYGTGTPQISCQVLAGRVEIDGDCDDQDDTVNPGALEICDGIDNDCDPATVELLETFYEDADGDGFGNPEVEIEACELVEGLSDQPIDCDDTDPARTATCDTTDGPKGCNCDTTAPSGALLGWIALLGLAVARRRAA